VESNNKQKFVLASSSTMDLSKYIIDPNKNLTMVEINNAIDNFIRDRAKLDK
jgi:hypothetical protein